MKNFIKLNKDTEIDLQKLVDSRLLVQANSGGGKSWLLRRLLEQSHGKIQQIVIDLEGEFSTLREKYDYVLAGKGGDTPASSRSAGLLARKLLELNVSAIIDLYELPHYERKHFVKLFLESMINAPKDLWHPCLVIIDEAHVFCPEKGQSEASEAVIDLATRGRKRGYCAVLATQRLSKLHKDAAAECNNKLVGRTGLDIDMKRAAEELGFTTKEQYLSLRNLESGEFFAFGPAISREVEKIKIGEVETTHPKAGSRMEALKKIAPTEKIKAVLGQLADLPAEAEKEEVTIRELQTKVRNLTRENGQFQARPEVTDSKQIEQAVKMALHKQAGEFDKQRTDWQRQIKNFGSILEGIGKMVNKALKIKPGDSMKQCIEVSQKSTVNDIFLNMEMDKKSLSLHPPMELGVDLPRRNDKTYYQQISKNGIKDFTLGRCERSILSVLAQRQGLSTNKSQLGLLSGYSSKSGGFNNSLGKLRSLEMIIGLSDNIKITEAGLGVAEFESLPTGAALQEYWKNKLGKCERSILEVLITNYPMAITKDVIGEASGYSSTSGGFNNALGKLRTLELIQGYGEIKASDNLFI